MTMLLIERIVYSPIPDRPSLKLPNGARIAVWVIVNVEEWDAKLTMPRTVLTPPAGGSPSPDIPNWAWHEYGNRVGFWRLLEAFDEFKIPGVSCSEDRHQVVRHRPLDAAASDKIRVDQLKAVESQIGLVGIEITQLDQDRPPEPGGQADAWKPGKTIVDSRIDENPMFPEAACGAYQFADGARCDHGVRSSEEATEQGVADAPGYAGRRDQEKIRGGMNRIVAGRIVHAVEQGLAIPVQSILRCGGDEARQ